MTSDHRPHCQSCKAPLSQTLVDLGLSPLANAFVPFSNKEKPDALYPLCARVCGKCWLVQVESVVPAGELFRDYAYFSSYSVSWLDHVAQYTEMVIKRFGLNEKSQVIEIASNDGYLLQNFVRNGIRSLGIEPAENVGKAAREKGVPTVSAFFGTKLAKELVKKGHRPDLVVAKNVLAHVPDINNFVGGIAILLHDDAVFTVEFPHLLNLLEYVQFDTIYHEHFSYLSLLAVDTIFRSHGLRIFDVEEIPTHGGSLRVFACLEDASHVTAERTQAVRNKENEANLGNSKGYQGFEPRVRKVKDDFLAFLHHAKAENCKVAAYGAAAKGNTLLNYCGVGPELIAYAVDRNPKKQNTLLPGSRIAVHDVQRLEGEPVDYVLILPWNLREEIETQLAPLRNRGFKFVTAIPSIRIDE